VPKKEKIESRLLKFLHYNHSLATLSFYRKSSFETKNAKKTTIYGEKTNIHRKMLA
jgi:hypothetical protein